jgi:mono/diheme cytochrome c family protein
MPLVAVPLVALAPRRSRRSSLAALSLSLLALPALADGPAGSAQAGKEVFQQNCVICHGPKGKGDGPAAAGLPAKPANFSERSSSEQRQLNVVTNGGAAEKLSPVMPPWGESLTEQQIRDVVAYVRTELSGAPVARK